MRQRQRNLKWEKTKQRGRKEFLFRYGVFGWGLWSGVLFLIINEGMSINSFKFSFTTVLYIALFMVGGYIWGIFMWSWMERLYGNRT
jgi:type II restriction/modification system DNA methylase subunit YeeA